MEGPGGRPAASVGFASAEEVACGPTSVLFRVSRARGGHAALKVFRLSGSPEEQASARSRMPRDWRIWSELAHPHVVRASDYGETNDALYVARRWIEGPSLRAALDRGRTLDAAQIGKLAKQLGSALDAAAAAQLIHLDLKPENVLFASPDGPGHAYVTDFGAGRLAAWKAGADTSPAFRGTVEYAAPEQIEGGAPDNRTVVYALGCLLYEALTGATPYAGRSSHALLRAHLEEMPPPVEGGPAELDSVFATALAKRPEERYATCTELAGALCAALAVAPAPRRAHGRRRRVGARHAAVAAAVGVVAAGVVAAASWLALGASGASEPAAAKPLATDEFLAALPSTKPTVKAARRSLPAAPKAKRVGTRKARVHAPAAPTPRSGAPAKPERHRVAPTRAPATNSAAPGSTSETPAIAPTRLPRPASPPAAPRDAARADTSRPESTAPVASTLPPPPPPPPSDPTTPPPPPPPP